MKSIVPCILVLLVADSGMTSYGQSPNDTPSKLDQIAPKGYIIPEKTISPDGHYGVTVPKTFENEDGKAKNSLIDLRTGRIVADLQTKFTGWSRQNHGGVLPACWSEDGSLLLWEVADKWTPDALTLVKIRKGHVLWQIDILKAAEKEILQATKNAKPKAYATAKKENEGSGAAYPEGFTVDVKTEDTALEFPLWISVILTADPKGIEGRTILESYLLGTVNERGKFSVKDFQLELPKSRHFHDSESFHFSDNKGYHSQ